MKPFCILLIVILSFIIQTKVSVFGISPDFSIAIVYYLGINKGAAYGMAAGSLIGSIADSLAGGILGPNLLGKGIAGFFPPLLFGTLFRWTPLAGMLGIFLITVLSGSVVFLSKTMFETMPAPPSKAILILLMQGLLNSAIGAFLRPENAD